MINNNKKKVQKIATINGMIENIYIPRKDEWEQKEHNLKN